MTVDISHLLEFLPCETPQEWIEQAVNDLPTIMIDHANCEKKAAATAMNLMFKYTNTSSSLLAKMSQLAREELLHFEQVVNLLNERGIEYTPLTPARYAQDLRRVVRTHDPVKLTDTLVVGAFIEARSCERFAALAKRIDSVDNELARYYNFLLKSESRHFEDYLSLAYEIGDKVDVDNKVSEVYSLEKALIHGVDDELRFHSGIINRSTIESGVVNAANKNNVVNNCNSKDAQFVSDTGALV